LAKEEAPLESIPPVLDAAMEAAETVLMAFGPIGMVVAAGVGFAYAALRPPEPSRKSKGVTQEYVRQEMQALTELQNHPRKPRGERQAPNGCQHAG